MYTEAYTIEKIINKIEQYFNLVSKLPTTMNSYALSEHDYQAYVERKPQNAVLEIWTKLLSEIDDHNLKQEAKSKGFMLVPNSYVEEDRISKCYLICVPNASPELDETIKIIGDDIIVLKD